ncbi:MAG: putative manganese-dependent inorganic diphosphatase [Lachnospiraceae bacterium]
MGTKMEENKEKIWVIGHKNPDTDSICSAIAYANLKNASSDGEYVPKRAGNVNGETQFVLDYFGVQAPEYVENAGAQVKDLQITKTKGVSSHLSMKRAWELMKSENVVTLPIVKPDKSMDGLIVTFDIAQSYMDVYDNSVLSTARTQYKNILETINGTMVYGNEHGYFITGKVVIGASSADVIEGAVKRDDLVILGNREDAQRSALEQEASCIIACNDAKFSEEICKLAVEKRCMLITTPYDTFTVARLINQSIPIKFVMKKEDLVTFELDDYVDEVKDVMSKERHRDFPVLDDHGKYVGMISRRNLMATNKKKVILVDHNEKSQAVDGIDAAEIQEIIDHHRIGSLETNGPVYFRNQPLGCTATIVYQMYQEQGVEITKEIAGLLCSAILSDTLMYRSPTCTPFDKEVCEKLAKIAEIEVEPYAIEMFTAGSDFKSKTPEEIFFQDFKMFFANDSSFGVGQISAMGEGVLREVKEKLLPYMETARKEKNADMVFIMLTNILDESTEMIFAGEGAENLVRNAYHTEAVEGRYVLPGVVSRKKQLIPSFMEALQA